MPRSTERTALYRLYDRDGDLLYVGVTNNLRRRWDMHSRDQSWWHLVAGREVEWLPDRASAEAAEVAAIQSESPRFNIDHSSNPKWGRANYDDTEDRRRAIRQLRRDLKKGYFHIGRTIHLAALAERYEVSSRTLTGLIDYGPGTCFAESKRRLTVVRVPDFTKLRARRDSAWHR